MEKIPTAKEFCEKKFKEINPATSWIDFNKEVMIEFAKLHVEAALKEASENVKLIEYGCSDFRVTDEDAPNPYFISGYFGEDSQIKISEDSILNSYPLENIK